jgi:hypothetical protein
MRPIDSFLTNEAVDMMKRGLPTDTVLHRLWQHGVAEAEARALVEKLTALQREAEAADPALRRAHLTRMLEQGAWPAHLFEHLRASGMAQQLARAEVDAVVAAFERRGEAMRPCDRCRRPTPPQETYFDRLGNQVCRMCHGRDEIAASESRVMDGILEAAGVPAIAVQSSHVIRR